MLIALSQAPQSAKAQVAVSNGTKTYTYMQVFFFGPITSSGSAFMTFTPAFHNQSSVKLDEPNMVDAFLNSPVGDMQVGEVQVSGRPNDAKYQAAEKKRSVEQAENTKKFLAAREKRAQTMRDQLLNSLNSAAAEGWEVVQMSAYGQGGLAYLLRRAK